MKTETFQIVNRGRGLQLSTSRITHDWGLKLFHFEDVALSETATHLEVWNRLALITGNRNLSGPDSLEATIRFTILSNLCRYSRLPMWTSLMSIDPMWNRLSKPCWITSNELIPFVAPAECFYPDHFRGLSIPIYQ